MIKDVLKDFITIMIGLIMFAVFTVVVCLILETDKKASSNEYYRSAEVFRIKNEVVYLEDTQGNVWCVENDTLKMFGRYVLVMDDCGTEEITDDVILRIE